LSKEHILNQIRKRRAEFKPANKRRPRKPKHPFAIEREYRRMLLAYVDIYIDIVKNVLVDKLPALASEARFLRPDSVNADSWVENLSELITSITFQLQKKTPGMTTSVETLAKKLNDWNYDEVMAVVRSVIGVDVFVREPWLSDQIRAFVDQQKYFIKNLPEEATGQIKTIAQMGLQRGASGKDIATEIEKRFGITRRRAEFIARDQVSKFNGALTALRQQEMGVTQYVWRTVGDNRVRPEHEEREDKVFNWSDPPDGGHPGEDYNCRCVAEPVLTGLLEEI